MSEQSALVASIVAEPDEDTPRLVYADWLDENRPDRVPSPVTNPSTRAAFIRTQCRLAAGAFADPDYPELLEREEDLATWLNVHDPELSHDVDGFLERNHFEGGEWGTFRRGFSETLDFAGYQGTPRETVAAMVEAIEESIAVHPGRTLRLDEVTPDEMALLVKEWTFERLRGLYLEHVSEGKDEVVAAVAGSRRSIGLRRLYFNFPLGPEDCEALARSPYLGNLESLVIDFPATSGKSIKAFGRSKWFRNLRSLSLWLVGGDGLRALADLSPMPRLTSLTLFGTMRVPLSAIRRFAASDAFPNLAFLDLREALLSADHVALLARGRWPVRHLRLYRNEVRKAGAEAIATAEFAQTLSVLDLEACEITAGGVQALAESESLSGLRHLNLADNPIGPGGLVAIAESPNLRQLRSLDLRRTSTARGPISARDVVRFLTNLSTPNLHHLLLDHLPVGIRGATVLGSSACFTNLTRLDVEDCGLGERGTRQLVASKTLTNLVALDVGSTKTGSGGGKLMNPAVLPRLASCYLGTGIPKATATRLRRRPGIIV